MALNTTDNTKRMTDMVLTAICNLQEREGSSLKNIVNFLESKYGVSEDEIVRPVVTALKRAVDFGFLRKVGGNYRINVEDLEDGSRYAKEHKRRRRSKKGEKSRKRSKSKSGKKRRRRRH